MAACTRYIITGRKTNGNITLRALAYNELSTAHIPPPKRLCRFQELNNDEDESGDDMSECYLDLDEEPCPQVAQRIFDATPLPVDLIKIVLKYQFDSCTTCDTPAVDLISCTNPLCDENQCSECFQGQECENCDDVVCGDCKNIVYAADQPDPLNQMFEQVVLCYECNRRDIYTLQMFDFI